MDKNTIIVNLFAGPGAGKTTCAWEIASELKKRNIETEYVSEYAKELVWDNRLDLLDGSLEHQKLLHSEQERRINRLVGKVDVVVTDSPALLNLMYLNEQNLPFEKEVVQRFKQHNNFNLFINRSKEFQQTGRIHNLEESKKIDSRIKSFLRDNDIYFGTYYHKTVDVLIDNIVKNIETVNKWVEKEKTKLNEGRKNIMKFKTTERDIKNNYPNIIKVGYCRLQNLLKNESPIAYTAGKYGWNADIYEVNPSTVIVTGSRPFGNIVAPYDLCSVYEKKAEEYLIGSEKGYMKDFAESRAVLRDFIGKFVSSTQKCDKTEYEYQKNVKTQVYLLAHSDYDDAENSGRTYNEVVLQQDDVALILETTPDGRFDGTVYDDTVNLYQTNADSHIDRDGIINALKENIGDGSGMYNFNELAKEALNGSTSKLTVLPWSDVTSSESDNSKAKGTCLIWSFVTEYNDTKLDEEIRAQVLARGYLKRAFNLTSDFEHNMDSSTDYNKEFNDRFSDFPEDLEQIKALVSNQFNLNNTDMNNLVNSDEGKRLIILWQDIYYYANASEFDENKIRREAFTYDPADPFTTAHWPSSAAMRADIGYRNLIDLDISVANKVVKNAKDFIHAYNFEEKFQTLALKLSGEADEQSLVEDNNCYRGR